MSETSISRQQYKKEILKYVIDKVNTFYQNESISFEVKLLLVPEDNSFKASKYGKILRIVKLQFKQQRKTVI